MIRDLPTAGKRNRRAGGLFAAYCGVAILVVLAAYSNSLRNGFHFDDSHVLVENLFIRDLANAPRFFTDARTFSAHPANATYRPVVSLTLAVDYRLAGGLNPFVFHVTQLALLILVGAMLYLLFARVFASAGANGERERWVALFAAALFCVHTANTQTVNYISARSELLAGAGVLGAFLLYIHRPRWRGSHLYLLPVVVGALAKTPAVMFAPLLLAYALLIEEQLSLADVFGGRRRERVRAALVAAAPAFVLGALLYLFVEGMNPPAQRYSTLGRMDYLLSQTWIWVRYAGLLFVPAGLSADTDLQGPPGWMDPRAMAGVALLGLSLFAIWRASRARALRPVAFGIAWFWIALVPSSTVFPLAEITNDHRMFFPFMGALPAIVWLLFVAFRRARPQVLGAAALAVLAAHGVATYQRNRVWKDEETLWRDVVATSPRNARGLMNYGLTQMQQGRLVVAKEYFDRAYGLWPHYPVLHVNLAIVTGALGEDDVAAEGWFRRALSTSPDYAAGHRFFGDWLVRRGRSTEAVTHLERAAELSMADVGARHSLIELYAARGDTTRLEALLRETLGFVPADPVARRHAHVLSRSPPDGTIDWRGRGRSHAAAGDHAAAASAYRNALALDSLNADAWIELGRELRTLGFFAEAAPALERALRLRPGDPFAVAALSAVKGEASGPRGASPPESPDGE